MNHQTNERSTNSRTSPVRNRPEAMIEPLEYRRMLAVFTGSSDFADAFEVYISPTSVEVVRNGASLGTTTDTNVIVDGLGSQVGLNPDTFDIFETGSGTRTARLNLTIRGTASDTVTSFGTAGSPIDLDTVNTNFFVDQGFSARVNIYDQDDDSSVEPFIAYLSTSERQVVAKGTFEIAWNTSDFANHDFFGGTSHDVFSFAGSLSNSSIDFNGGAGNDLVQTINFNNNNHDNDIDAAISGSFNFIGGPGNDFYDLDDSGDQTGDGDSNYGIAKGLVTKPGKSARFQEVEQVSVVCDAENNQVRFFNTAGEPGEELVTVNGGLGNDTFTNFSTGGAEILDLKIGGIIGGPGLDTIDLSDVDNPNSRSYIFEPDVFNFNGDDVEYDSTTETFLLEENNISSTNRLLGKPAGMAMNINALGGSDSFQSVGGGDLDDSGLLETGITVSGGAGSDDIIFDDSLDGTVGGEDEAYAFGNFTLAKGGLPLNYNAFESQKLLVGNGDSPGANTVPTVNLNAISGQIVSTTIDGGALRGCTVNVGNGNLAAISGNLTLSLEGGTINFNDQSAPAARSYQLTAGAMTSPRPITFSGATALDLNGGPLNDSFVVSRSAIPTALKGNNGSDSITLGQGNIDADLLGVVTVNGGAGANTLIIDNSLDTLAEVQTLTAANFSDGLTHGYGSIQNLIVNEGAGGTNLAANSISNPTTINGGSGDDVISIGAGSLASNLGANVVVNGGAGTDGISLLGQNDSGTNTYAFPAFNQFRFGDVSTGKFVNFSGLEQATLRTGIGGDTIDVTTVAIPLSIFSGAGNDAVTVSASTAPVTVDTGPEQSVPFGFRQGDSLIVGGILGTASVVVEQNDTVIHMGVNTGSTLRLAAGAVLNKAWPTVFFIDLGTTLSGTFDLGSGAFLWRSGGSIIPDFRALLTRGHNNGAWNGTSANGAINSSLANASVQRDGVGYGLGSEIAPTTIGGFSIAPGDTLLRYTLDGDANLDAQVNLADFNRLASNFGQSNRAWVNGDSNYDGMVNLNDFNALAGNFGAVLSPQRSAAVHTGGLRERLEELS